MVLKVTVTGDSFISQGLPRGQKELIDLKEIFDSGDICFTNLETTIHNFDVYPSAVSGGTWAAARPSVLNDLKWLGFNLLAWANNHTLDWSHNGVEQTKKYIEECGFVHAGVGLDLYEANAPKYIDTPNGKVALIATNSTHKNWHVAGSSRPGVLGRPGLNPLRFLETHYVSKEDFHELEQIIKKTSINAKRELDEKEGFARSNDGQFQVGEHVFAIGDGEYGTKTTMNLVDANRIKQSIKEAKRQADIVLVSHHAHEMKGNNKEIPADFIEEFARFCIDQGADAYVGHGPHILRGIEIYNGRPILYSLGDFIFQNEQVERQPTEFYDIYQMTAKHTVADGFDARSNNGTRGLVAQSNVYESVITEIQFDNNELKQLKLIPITLGFDLPRSQKGKPQLATKEKGIEILKDLQRLSKPYHCSIKIVDGIGYIGIK